MDKPWLRQYDPEIPPSLEYPRIPLYQILDDTATRYPDRPGINFFGRRLTYGRVKEMTDRLATGLRTLGIAKGEHVALLLPNSPPFVVAYYGLLKAGAVVVSLNPLSAERELAFQIDHAEVETIITIPLFLQKGIGLRSQTPLKRIIYTRLSDFLPFPFNLVQGFREGSLLRSAGWPDDLTLVNFRQLLDTPLPAGFRPQPASPDEMAVLLYSGGTTGVAKGIMLSHFNLVANAHQLRVWGHIREVDRLLGVLPLFHGYGMSVNMNTAILGGGEMILLPRFSAREVAQAIQKHRPTFFTGVPTMFVALSHLPDMNRYDFSSLKGIFVGAAPLTLAIKEDFETKTGGRMIEGYGLTEAVTAIMANPYHGLHKIGSIGIPFPDVEMKIVSLDGSGELPPGKHGEIVLRSPTVMLGYYKQPEETQKAILDGWLYTGDIGYMDDNGYFYITDRKKDLIITGGFNVFPREIDEVIYMHPKVKEGIAVGIPDPYAGERIKVFIVLKEGMTATAEEFIAYFRQNLTAYKVPSEVEFRTELPKNMIGKILRRALREEAIRKAEGASAATPPHMQNG